MPVLGYRTKIICDDYNEELVLYFNCRYDKGKLKLSDNGYFDSGDYRVKVTDITKKLNAKLIDEYSKQNDGVLYLGILNYYMDNIMGLYAIKFISNNDESIYYVREYNTNDLV